MSDPTLGPPPSRAQRFVAFLHRHPIFTLALLTPGIPEYVLGSSNLGLLVILPPVFVAFLLVNVAIYTTGALLIREAVIRWKKGFATLLALGTAYAIVEEGVGTATFFNPNTAAAGGLGFYGHYLGVSWIFTLGIIGYHTFISIGLPIALLGRILPETQGKSILHGRQVPLVIAIMALDAGVVMFPLISRFAGFTTPLPLVIACLIGIAGLIALAWWLPRDLLVARTPRPVVSPIRCALLGAAFEPAVLLAEAVPAGLHVPALIDFGLLLGVGAAFLYAGLRGIGREGNDLHVVALGIGVVLSLALFGVLITFPIPVTLVAGGLALWGLSALYLSLERTGRVVPIPPGALTGVPTSP